MASTTPSTSSQTSRSTPTYGDLIDLYEKVNGENPNSEEALSSEFKKAYPECPVGRSRRFYDAVQRIVAPTKPSVLKKPSLLGSPLQSYRRREWKPRIRNPMGSAPGSVFPPYLKKCGLTEELLERVFNEVLEGKEPTWNFNGIPETKFYKELHHFLKKWHVSRGTTKQAIGRFYMAIDPNFKEMRADNAYRLIERLPECVQSKIMSYGKVCADLTASTQQMAAEAKASAQLIEAMHMEAKTSTQKVEALTLKCAQLTKQFEESRKELTCARKALRDISNEKVKLQKQCTAAKAKDKAARLDYAVLENTFTELQDENIDLSSAISDLQDELESCSAELYCKTSTDRDFSLQTKHGRRYSPSIRCLYYHLLSQQIPALKIADIIRTVIRCFFPAVDVDTLQLPKRSCADYMRKCELVTISNAHEATVLSECESGFRLHTDGTTKHQKKIGGVGINDMVISVNEVADGTAISAMEDVSKELEKLRETAHALQLPRADRINWTLFTSSTSDSAATQKRFNKLIQDCRDKDELQFGSATPETLEIIESLCSMHLGSNLRKAFLSGMIAKETSTEKHHPVDKFVHEFCKLLGRHGTPEYGSGVHEFPDYLKIMIEGDSLDADSRQYYQVCATVNLHRQVGSRYFVSASNAARIYFLADAALAFLKYTGKDRGNKLDMEVYAKLTNVQEMAQLRADALFYYHVYADLVMLSKSKKLAKCVMDMNNHYLELLCFLNEVQDNPEVVLRQEQEVFQSEKRLYGTNKVLNHRKHRNVDVIYCKLFTETGSEFSLLFPMIAKGAASMKEKLLSYAEKQLPGGEYWTPEPAVRKVLMQLEPSNDFCESILGLNDYLTTAIPNLTQASRSNLVQVKKNHTMQWLGGLSDVQRETVVHLAEQERQKVNAEQKQSKKDLEERRRQRLRTAHEKREALQRKAQKQRDELSEHHLITSSDELRQAMIEIEGSSTSQKQMKSKKLVLLKTQINLRKKVLGQSNIHIPFTQSRKQRPVSDILNDLESFIDNNPLEYSAYFQDPGTMVGKRMRHKFLDADTNTFQWYDGTILEYDPLEKKHEVKYENETDQYKFDLILDILSGDLEVLS